MNQNKPKYEFVQVDNDVLMQINLLAEKIFTTFVENDTLNEIAIQALLFSLACAFKCELDSMEEIEEVIQKTPASIRGFLQLLNDLDKANETN